MALSREEVLKVAKLSMLEFNESEVVELQSELNEILEFMTKLEEADVEGVEPMSQVNEMINAFRKDEIKQSVRLEDAIKNAPESMEGTFVVPRTVSGN